MCPQRDNDSEATMVGALNISEMLQDSPLSPTFLVVSGQASAGKMFKLRGEMFIGRANTSDIYLDDDGVSRRHARVMVGNDGSVQVFDLNSTNGTYHNGERISTHVLRDGDTIQIGSTTILKFSYRDALEEELQKNLYNSATRDGLTQAYNKKYFGEALRREFAHALRQQTPLTLVMFDIDHFKKINDQHGHTAGDHVLSKLAVKVHECIRAEDTFARYGGEEFALLLREASEKQGFACAERIRRTVESTDFIPSGGQRIPVTSSFGVATFTGTEFTLPEQLIEAADQFLYQAKRGGRNRVEARMLTRL
jgi:two-component system cell cycle response regulator